ncbi:Putative type II secretion system protein D [Aquicella siphonis]|uniref:Type II secretion system protein D n=1 Tax=Aquicella siphonis TaxID=254247 RepID=A0A5E4PFF9_9COXI|nr:type II secretion system secretin GspD [Aquicella siphonis]VVC75066.1 Putative type II secretion system protein D [Aquicella siphonis]
MKFFPLMMRKLMSQLSLAVVCGLWISSASFSEQAPAAAAVKPQLKAANVQGAQPVDEVSVKASVNAEEPVKPAKRLWNLQDADIMSVITEVSQETGKNFIVDPRVSGKISLISSKPLKQNEVYQVFLSVLGLLGYSAIPSGNVVKIVPNMESGEQATPVASNQLPGKGDEVVVRVIPLENVSASQLIPVLRPLLPQWSNISAYTPGNVIILLGRASNLDRIHTIIEDVDKASTSGIQMIPLRHASAPQVALVLNNLQSAARAAGESSTVSIAVDERSNSLLLGGPKAARLRMRVLVSQLDAPSQAPSGNTEVIYLRYLEAKTLAPLLSKIAANILGKNSGGPAYESTSTNTSPASSTTSSVSKEISTNSPNIQAEPNTNAIIITAPPALMQALKSVIAKLDIRPAQVLVEAIIAEIDESNLTSLGIQWGSVASDGTVQTTNGSAISFPPLGAGVVGIMPSVQIQAVLSILRNQNGVDILSTPSIMVLDNQKATIEVGQDVPFQTGSYATSNNATTVTPFTTNQYKPVTLKLDVTPQINLGTSVRLKLSLKNDTLQNPQNPGLTPLINTSKISNTVIIKSDDVLVLGGLISNSNNESINKVPILGDVPIIGPLFQQKTTNQQKKNLMVFIKPIIIHNNDAAMTISETKYNEVRKTQANFRGDLATIGDEPAPTKLPPWKNKHDLPLPFAGKDPIDPCPPGSDQCP